jgi:uroporphyrinogen decarboxylase
MADSEFTSLKRVQATLNHQEPDRVPYDLGGCGVCGIHERAYRRLREYLNLPARDVTIADQKQQLAEVDEDVKQRLEVDVYPNKPGSAAGFEKSEWTEGRYHKFRDEWGIEWWMPVEGGFYYDMRAHPLSGIETVADLEKYPFPNPLDEGRFAGLATRAEQLTQQQQVATKLGRNAAGVLEVALWLRGFEDFYCDLIANRPLAEALLDKLLEIKMRYWARALEEVGENVTMVCEADDLAGQESMLIAPQLYREVIKPRHTKLFAWIKKHSRADVKIFYHSCGAVSELIPDLIESGIDILNPVQVSAKGMDTKALKRDFGNDVVFYGGGVDTQHVLPHGSVQQVRDEVTRRIDDLAPGGGFVFTTVHNIQADVPPENIMAMWETLQEKGVY